MFKQYFYNHIVFLILAAILPCTSFSESKSVSNAEITSDQQILVEKVNNYLGSIAKFKADFIQISPDNKSDKGTISIERPSHLRIDYSTTPISLIVKGDVLTYYDRDLDQKSQLLTSNTAASLITSGILSIVSDNTNLISIHEDDNFIYAKIQAKKAQNEGEFTLGFTTNPMELKQIVVRDIVSDKKYTITMHDVQYSPSFAGDLFKTTSFKKLVT